MQSTVAPGASGPVKLDSPSRHFSVLAAAILAEALFHRGGSNEAIPRLEQALTLCRSCQLETLFAKVTMRLGFAYGQAGRLYQRSGRDVEARACVTTAGAMDREMGMRPSALAKAQEELATVRS